MRPFSGKLGIPTSYELASSQQAAVPDKSDHAQEGEYASVSNLRMCRVRGLLLHQIERLAMQNVQSPLHLADDTFWNDPETLAAIDSIEKAVEWRNTLNERLKRMQRDGPSFSLGISISSDDDDANQGRRPTGGASATPSDIPQTTEKSPEIATQLDGVGLPNQPIIGEENELQTKGGVSIEVDDALAQGDDVHRPQRPKRHVKHVHVHTMCTTYPTYPTVPMSAITFAQLSLYCNAQVYNE
ncbi:tRNA N6-adenosine threonylcarbamoyltransferase [Striga asiatica]|uniref:tRNA N6-adenosine threonylcarbamoyltransferase n=1 Tax=Striga asiatica TaxID=4170 RepID=A0A5A7RB70_STRAF|nr:tRNA N6-adenosine threonylcarbamoyltransferase [Striga asiatica]